MAVRAALCVVAHLRCAVNGAFVCALAPSVSAIQGRILYVLVPTGTGCAFRVEFVADFGHRLNDMARIRRGGAAKEEVVVLLAVGGLECLVLWAIFEFGADSERC